MDDTNYFVSVHNELDNIYTTNTELKKICNWKLPYSRYILSFQANYQCPILMKYIFQMCCLQVVKINFFFRYSYWWRTSLESYNNPFQWSFVSIFKLFHNSCIKKTLHIRDLYTRMVSLEELFEVVWKTIILKVF